MNKLKQFIDRLQKRGVTVTLVSNYPWVYLATVNGKRVKEKFRAEHGFTVAFEPIEIGKELEFTDTTEIFKIIRKYK